LSVVLINSYAFRIFVLFMFQAPPPSFSAYHASVVIADERRW